MILDVHWNPRIKNLNKLCVHMYRPQQKFLLTAHASSVCIPKYMTFFCDISLYFCEHHSSKISSKVFPSLFRSQNASSTLPQQKKTLRFIKTNFSKIINILNYY